MSEGLRRIRAIMFFLLIDCEAMLGGESPPSGAKRSEAVWSAIEGSVQTVDSTPVAGATVCALRRSSRRPPPLECVQADATGKYRLRVHVGRFSLWAGAQGFVPELYVGPPPWRLVLAAANGIARRDLVLRPGGRAISGVVTDRSGKPISGARILAGALGIGIPTTSDSKGRFAIWSLQELVLVSAEARGFAVAQTSVALRVDSVSFRLERGARLAGVVVADGKPVVGAKVTVYAPASPMYWGAQRTEITGADGTYEFVDLPSYVYRMEARKGVWRGQLPASVNVPFGGHVTAPPIDLSKVASVTGRIVDARTGSSARFRIPAFGSISGAVETSNGKPPPFFRLTLQSDNGSGSRVETFVLTKGQWSIGNLPSGTYKIQAVMPEGAVGRDVVLAEGEAKTGVVLVAKHGGE